MRLTTCTRLVSLSALLVLLTACGGGSGGGGFAPEPDPEPTVFAESYHWVQRGGMPGALESMWGWAAADGHGRLTRTLFTSLNGVVTGPTTQPEVEYSDSDAGYLSFDPETPAYGFADIGGRSEDGAVALLGRMYEGGAPYVYALIRRSLTFTGYEVDGDYHAVVAAQGAGAGLNATSGTATFSDGWTATVSWRPWNSEGVVVGIVPTPWDLAFFVAPDGTMRVNFPLVGGMDGGVLEGGELCIVGGAHRPDAAAGTAVTMAFLREATTADHSSLWGTYVAVAVDTVPTSGENRAYMGVLVSDGGGGVTFSPRVNTESHVGISDPAETTTYEILDASGRMRLIWGARTLEGGISESGELAILAGSTDHGDPPTLMFLVRTAAP